MKKIIISLNDFRQGGIPRCLHSLLTLIDKDKYQVDIICLDLDGPYHQEIESLITSKGGKLLKYNSFVRNICTFSSTLKRKGVFDQIAIVLSKIIQKGLFRILGIDLLELSIKRKAKQLSNKYDVAISYAEGRCSLLVSHTDCVKKLIWIHNDYKYTTQAGIGTDFQSFNKICCVSEATRISFAENYPQLADKTVTIYNVINHKLIDKLSQIPTDNMIFCNQQYTIVSIGRISYQKQFTEIPKIASKLKSYGCNFQWYIIGDGPEKDKVKAEIERNNLQKTVILLGKQNNPYKYLAKADLFALTSVYESYPTVVNEALVLNIPIISNDIPPIYEMIDETQGIIAPINQWDKILADIIHTGTIRINRTKIDFEAFNNNVMNKFYELIECDMNITKS